MPVLELGPVPAFEDCVQVGSEDYLTRAKIECTTYMDQLRREFPDAQSHGVSFAIHSFNHDFGMYYEVVAKYSTDEGMDYAYLVDETRSNHWDSTSDYEVAMNHPLSKVWG